jgi:hypothetical protein
MSLIVILSLKELTDNKQVQKNCDLIAIPLFLAFAIIVFQKLNCVIH